MRLKKSSKISDSMALIGYEVQYVHNDITVTDFYTKRILLTTWEQALEASIRVSNEEVASRSASRSISLIQTNSKHMCEHTGCCTAFVHYLSAGASNIGKVIILAVYSGEK